MIKSFETIEEDFPANFIGEVSTFQLVFYIDYESFNCVRRCGPEKERCH